MDAPMSPAFGPPALSPEELNDLRSHVVSLKLGDFGTELVGEKNVSNATAVIALLHHLGFAPERIASAIAGFRGATRRQDELFRDHRFRVRPG